MTTAVALPSIVLDDRGRPIMARTRFKVMSLILEHLAWGHTVEQLVEGHPPLNLAQVYAALTYYDEHQEEIDLKIRQDDEEFERQLEAQRDSPIRQKLRSLGLIP
jgi:uncharacterized protein (DUF433 family)